MKQVLSQSENHSHRLGGNKNPIKILETTFSVSHFLLFHPFFLTLVLYHLGVDESAYLPIKISRNFPKPQPKHCWCLLFGGSFCDLFLGTVFFKNTWVFFVNVYFRFLFVGRLFCLYIREMHCHFCHQNIGEEKKYKMTKPPQVLSELPSQHLRANTEVLPKSSLALLHVASEVQHRPVGIFLRGWTPGRQEFTPTPQKTMSAGTQKKKKGLFQ